MNDKTLMVQKFVAAQVRSWKSRVLAEKERFAVRVVAPLEVRIQSFVRRFGMSRKDAKRRILNTESKRRAFVRQSFHENITDPHNYDLIINTGKLSINSATTAVIAAIRSGQ
jgi:cytidylate kinase